MRLAGLGLLAGWACAPGSLAPPPGSGASSAHTGHAAEQPADTLRGVVAETGYEPATLLVLHTAGGRVVPLDGERRLLRRVVGLEVTVRGAPVQGGFGVREVRVRAHEGVAAVDGVLDRRGGAYLVVTRDGQTLAVPHLPQALRGMIGGRVWLAGPLDQPPHSFGVLSEPVT